jgi:hypothetical protein
MKNRMYENILRPPPLPARQQFWGKRLIRDWNVSVIPPTPILIYLACEQALKLNWEPASMTNEFEYLRLKSWREILIGQML